MEFLIPDVRDNYFYRHSSGNIHFGPDGYLYVTHGDMYRYPEWAQNLSLPFGKIHRIDVRPPYREQPNAARAPQDNPFYDDGNPEMGQDDRIWSYGHRNSFDFAFDRAVSTAQPTPSNSLIVAENGPECHDEIIRVVKGYNQRWPLDYDCSQPPQDATGLLPTDPPIPPLAFFNVAIAPTGVTVYSGSIRAWKGDLFFCALNTNRLYHAKFTPDRTQLVASPVPVDLPGGAYCQVDVETGANGALYMTTPRSIYRIRPAVLCPADLDADLDVDITDVQGIAGAFREARNDITGDGVVTLDDVMIAVASYNQPCE
jgi:glucose/arabinose dehydrogenase